MTSLTSLSDWEAARQASHKQPVLIYKHSAICPASAWAERNVQTWQSDHTDYPVYRVVVQSAREVSDQIADDLNLRHETPQAIFVHQGDVVAHENHHGVSAERLTKALHRLKLDL